VDIDAAMARGEFRTDLFHRLSVVRIHLPALRERPEDIVPLARYFLRCICQKLDTSLTLSPEAERLLAGHDLPGNVRQLRHVLEHAATMAHRGLLAPAHFSSLTTGMAPAVEPRAANAPPLGGEDPALKEFEAARSNALALFERRYLETLLEAAQWNVSGAARSAGISRQYLQRLLKRHEIDVSARRLR
jgi:DNA-binding NtrC family response regulator